MAQIAFKIITPEKVVYEDTIDALTIDTKDGEITVLPDHMPLVSVLKSGAMQIRKGGEAISMAVLGGFLEVRKGSEVVVLADSAERAEEIDIAKAEEARQRAEDLMRQKVARQDDVEYARVAAALEKELARLRVARRHRAHGGAPSIRTQESSDE